jgi:hypothetical protein
MRRAVRMKKRRLVQKVNCNSTYSFYVYLVFIMFIRLVRY